MTVPQHLELRATAPLFVEDDSEPLDGDPLVGPVVMGVRLSGLSVVLDEFADLVVGFDFPPVVVRVTWR